MSKNEVPSETQGKSDGKKQIRLNVDGCTVKLNIVPNRDGAAKIESVKRMILNGLAKI